MERQLAARGDERGSALMRAHRTRMLAAVLGTAVLVTGFAPAAVLAGKPADHGNPHATAPAPEPSANPSTDPVEPHGGADRRAHRAADSGTGGQRRPRLRCPATSDTPAAERGATPDQAPTAPDVAAEAVDEPARPGARRDGWPPRSGRPRHGHADRDDHPGADPGLRRRHVHLQRGRQQPGGVRRVRGRRDDCDRRCRPAQRRRASTAAARASSPATTRRLSMPGSP